jgi:hypothetical protein
VIAVCIVKKSLAVQHCDHLFISAEISKSGNQWKKSGLTNADLQSYFYQSGSENIFSGTKEICRLKALCHI